MGRVVNVSRETIDEPAEVRMYCTECCLPFWEDSLVADHLLGNGIGPICISCDPEAEQIVALPLSSMTNLNVLLKNQINTDSDGGVVWMSRAMERNLSIVFMVLLIMGVVLCKYSELGQTMVGLLAGALGLI